MTRINLLPWRFEYVQYQNRKFYSILAVAAVVMFLIMLTINSYVKMLHGDLESDIAILLKNISEVKDKALEIDKLKVKKAKILERKSVIEDLQQNRMLAIKVLDSIARIVPKYVFLTELKKRNNTLTLEGIGASNSKVARMIKRIEKNPLFENVKIKEIKALENKGEKESRSQENVFFAIEIELRKDV